MVNILQPQSVAIVGPGGVGGFLAAVFWKHGIEVTCVGRKETVERIQRNGLRLESSLFGTIHARPRAVIELDTTPHIIFIAVKATHLLESLQKMPLKKTDSYIVIPLLNGYEHVEVIRKYVHNHLVVGSITIESFKKDNHIVHRSPFATMNIASDNNISITKVRAIAAWLNGMKIKTNILPSENMVLWKKLVRLNTMSLVSSAANAPMSTLHQDPLWGKSIKKCIEEGASVANTLGVHIDEQEELRFIKSLRPGFLTSMHRDLLQEKKIGA
jgi:2-dehydropantoate 2-reductase